ncbi:MAG: fibrinogen-like YCDxxxxGGGW domain-containing protein [Myxococcota bacterium]
MIAVVLAMHGCALGEGTFESDSPGLGSGGEVDGADTQGSGTAAAVSDGESGNIPVTCGDGVVDPGEQCDDGNDDDTDACTRQCQPPSCDDGLLSGGETDVDCGGSCPGCPFEGQCVGPEDCETGFCRDMACDYPTSCRELLEHDPSALDGVFMIDPDGPGGVDPMGVSCDMSTDGGGWIRLSLQNSDGVVVAQDSAGNPWDKCADDGAGYFAWIDEGTISADISPGGSLDEEVALSYQNPADGTIYSTVQVEALRSVVSELSPSTRMVAMTADDDNNDWHTDMMGGHEVYVRGPSGDLTLLSPGTNGECGGADDWPAAGSMSAFYLWSHAADSSVVAGTTGLTDADLTGLPPAVVLPTSVRLVVQTGGGVAFGWEQQVFLVR